jgi:hypothetical protein
MKKKYINQLTWPNISLRVPDKEIFLKYFPGARVEAGREFLLVPKGQSTTVKGQFGTEGTFGQFVFVPTEGDDRNGICSVNFIAQSKGIRYNEALQIINRDFNLRLSEADTELHSQQDDIRHARKNGVMTVAYLPAKAAPALKDLGSLQLLGIEICSVSGMSMVIGQHGCGKSKVMEIVCASFCNPQSDGLGFSFPSELKEGKIMYVDVERVEKHLYSGWEHVVKRSGLSKQEVERKVIFAGYRKEFAARLNKLERDIFQHRPSVLIIDGVAKFVDDINNFTECVGFNKWLSDMAETYKLMVLLTIHANPNDMKAQGHLGSILMKEAESVLAIKYDRLKDDVPRTLTTRFQHGKVRGDYDKVEAYFQWSKEKCGFVSCAKVERTSTEGSLRDCLVKAFEAKEHLTYKELGQRMSDLTGNTYDTERRKIGGYVEMQLLTLKDSFYYLNVGRAPRGEGVGEGGTI